MRSNLRQWRTGTRKPFVTVIITTHNSEGVIADSLLSLDGQNAKDYELVVADDCSVDNTCQIVSTMAESLSHDICLVKMDVNSGVAATRNAALEAARGEYVWFVDDDDEYPQGALAALESAARDTDADMITAQAIRKVVLTGEVVPVTSPKGGLLLDQKEAVGLVATGELQGHLWSKLIRRSTLGDEPFPALKSKSDFGGVLHALKSLTSLASLDHVVYHYTWRSDSLSTGGRSSPLDMFAAFDQGLQLFKHVGLLNPLNIAEFKVVVARVIWPELWRFGKMVPDYHEAAHRASSLIAWHDVYVLTRARHLRAAVTAFSLKLMPHALGSLYRLKRSRRTNY